MSFPEWLRTIPDSEHVLGSVGLKRRSAVSDSAVAGVSLFAAGLLVGVALALAFAPKPGEELRRDVRDRLDDLRSSQTA